MSDKLRDLVTKHEGLRLKPYFDTAGKISIGVGRNLSDNGISVAEADDLLTHDLNSAIRSIWSVFPMYETFSENRFNALVDMMFNLGMSRFLTFRNMIAAIDQGDWRQAAWEMRNSSWATQLPSRVEELATLIEEE